MKVDIRIVSLSMLVGVALIIFDFLMDSTFLKDMSNDQHQLIMGMVILGTFFAFGLVVSHQFYIFREAERRASQASVFLQQLINAIPAPVFPAQSSGEVPCPPEIAHRVPRVAWGLPRERNRSARGEQPRETASIHPREHASCSTPTQKAAPLQDSTQSAAVPQRRERQIVSVQWGHWHATPKESVCSVGCSARSKRD